MDVSLSGGYWYVTVISIIFDDDDVDDIDDIDDIDDEYYYYDVQAPLRTVTKPCSSLHKLMVVQQARPPPLRHFKLPVALFLLIGLSLPPPPLLQLSMKLLMLLPR